VDEGSPTYSIAIEWENARLSELRRTRVMIGQLHEQIVEVGRRRPEIIIPYDRNYVNRGQIEKVLGEVSELEAWPADIRNFPTEGLGYQEQKNFGAGLSRSDIIVFLDSDCIPE
jgi:hypothetical protein